MATEKLQIYKCEICGNIVQILIPSYGELVCCNQPMKLQEIQHDKSEVGEKHAPVIEMRECVYRIYSCEAAASIRRRASSSRPQKARAQPRVSHSPGPRENSVLPQSR